MKNMSRGFMEPFLILLLLILMVVAGAWWIRQNKIGYAPVPVATGSQASTDRSVIVTPTSGTAPLTVAFSVSADASNVEQVNYGDGESLTVSDFVCSIAYCIIHHTYAAPGTYTATFEDASNHVLRTFTISVNHSQ